MVEHPHVLEQPVIVQTFITIVTVVTILREGATGHVCLLAIGLTHLLARKVCCKIIMWDVNHRVYQLITIILYSSIQPNHVPVLLHQPMVT